MILYTYFRSSASYRVRLALHLKGIPYEPRYVHLLRGGGEQLSAEYKRLNPLGRVPTLIDGEQVLTQSGAIMEYLEERYPDPPIMPQAVADRAFVRAIAQTIVADIQPLQNLSVARYLSRELKQPQEAIDAWMRHWVGNGLQAVETLLAGSTAAGNYCSGGHPTIADICLVAQCVAARRFKVTVEDYKNIARIDAHCREKPEFRAAAPEAQADFEP
jgi:maleylpyruvate isomerase